MLVFNILVGLYIVLAGATFWNKLKPNETLRQAITLLWFIFMGNFLYIFYGRVLINADTRERMWEVLANHHTVLQYLINKVGGI